MQTNTHKFTIFILKMNTLIMLMYSICYNWFKWAFKAYKSSDRNYNGIEMYIKFKLWAGVLNVFFSEYSHGTFIWLS